MIENNPILIHHFLEQSATLYQDKTALIHEDIRVTYSQINSAANHLARWLLDKGILPGDRVVLLLENSLQYVVSYYGVLKAGAIAVPLSSDLKPESLRFFLNELEPKFIISNSRFERLFRETDLSFYKLQSLILKTPKLNWSSAPFSVFDWEDLVKNEESSNPDISIGKDTLASIIYTSGSTGTPKGVMLSHKNITSNTQAICQYLNLTENDVQMVVLPFFYVMGKSLLNSHFAVGGTVVINNKFAFPATVVKQMVVEKVTGFSGVPSTYAHLLHRSPLEKCRDEFKTLRYCSQAGGHMAAHLKKELLRVLPAHTKIYVMYGATEASARLTYLDPSRFGDKMGSIGKPIPGVSLKVLDKDSQEVSKGQTGELVASGPNIMQGYWKDGDATASVLDDHGYHSGDQGYQDEEGFYYVTGRKDRLLKVGGHRINPREIEDVLMATGLVIESAVVGVPDALLGQKLVAIVAPLNEDCGEKILMRESAQKLPKYKLPREIKIVKSLPKSTSGKIDRRRCLELAEKAD